MGWQAVNGGNFQLQFSTAQGKQSKARPWTDIRPERGSQSFFQGDKARAAQCAVKIAGNDIERKQLAERGVDEGQVYPTRRGSILDARIETIHANRRIDLVGKVLDDA